TRNLLLSPGKTFKDTVLFSLDSKTTKIILNISFDPGVIGVREEFDIVIYNSLGIEVARYDPFISGFNFRQELTLNTNGISLSGNITNDHAILVHIPATNTDFWDNESFGTGNGITFAQGGDEVTELNFDIEGFDGGTDDANIWVEYTETFDSVTDSTMWLYYGGSDTDNSDGSATYPSTYTSVWHMDETSGTDLFDSTSNNFDLNNTNTPTLSEDAQIGKGVKYERTNNEFSSNNDLLDDGYSILSISLWVKKPVQWDSGATDSEELVHKMNTTADTDRMNLEWRSTGDVRFSLLDASSVLDQIISSKTTWAAETWFHMVITFDSVDNNMAFYVDGSTGDGGTRSDAMNAIVAGSFGDFLLSRNGAFPGGQTDA
ncbi:hypothetical protein LCGC14_2958010, partial [marine sediment metagenome]